ncbi:MAG TPA: SIMPL domain-containing protein [Candidatus Acidoferrales bacterium]|nr:SIMPL domain-containing protein [Candidatus Acidoferrales bacterium]
MNRTALCLVFVCVFALPALAQQNEQTKFIADTLVVQANGTYEAEPDLATLTFDISSQDKDLTQAYTKATQAMQQIVAVAEKNGLTKQEISTGVLTLTPSDDMGHNKKPKSYYVQGQIVLKVHDFTKIGAILNDSVANGLANFRSLEYSLENPEAAKARAAADAMSNAVERAKAALAANGQKPGAIRYANLDIGQIVGIMQYSAAQLESATVYVPSEGLTGARDRAPAPPSPPPVQPGKITVSATVQCAFQIQ